MTAVEWLEVKLDNIGLNSDIIGDYIQQAKEMEKQQQGYSEEEVVYIVKRTMYNVHCWGICEGDKLIDFKISPRQWFEQFKNK